MINGKYEKEPFLSKVGKPNFSSKNIPNNEQEILDSHRLEKELSNEAKRNAHKRNELLQDIKNDVAKSIYKWLLPFVLLLLLIWCICCAINANEVKSGVEWLLSTILTLLVGALIGKFI